MNKRYEALLDEQTFPYKGMTLEERNYCLSIIKYCKDICDTENKVDNESACKIIEMHFKKENNVVNFNGSLRIGKENRCIDGNLYVENDNYIIADYQVMRLCVSDPRKEYRVLDQFKIHGDKIVRESQYNYNMITIYDEIKKGKIK